MTELENKEGLTVKFDEIKELVSEVKSGMMNGEECNNQFYSIMQTLDGLVSAINNIENEKSKPTDEFAILQTNILEVKKELSGLTHGIDIIINTHLAQLISKLTEKVNRLEILTNNVGIDQQMITEVAGKVEKNLSVKLKDSVDTLYSQGATSTESVKKDIIELNENLKDCVDYLEKAVKAISDDVVENLSGDMTVLGSTIEKTHDNLKRSIIDIFTRIQERIESEGNSKGSLDTSSLNETVEMLKTGMYNLNVNTEQRFTKLNRLIEEMEVFTKLQNFSRLKDLPAIGDLKNTLKMNINEIVDEYSSSLQMSQNREEITQLTQKFRKDVYNSILSMLGNVSEFLLDETSVPSGSGAPVSSFSSKLDELTAITEMNNTGYENIQKELKDIRTSIQDLMLNGTGSKDSELGEVVRECTRSIIENSEPDRHIIKDLLFDIKKNISILQSGDEEAEYTYSMQDIESDVAKIRIYLNELSQNGLSLDSDEFRDELNNIFVVVDSIKQQLNKIDECDLADTMTKLQDDVTSVSTRINKLLLTSDNSYNMVDSALKEFKLLSQDIDEQIKAISSTNRFKNLEEGLTAVKIALAESNSYNSVINQSLVMLAEWVDNAGEMITNISEKQDKLDSLDELRLLLDEAKTSVSGSSDDIVSSVKSMLEETNALVQSSAPVDYSETLSLLNGKLEEQNLLIEKQEDRLNKLDEKLSTILEFVAKNDASQLSAKLGEIDDKMERLNSSIEKLTSFINED